MKLMGVLFLGIVLSHKGYAQAPPNGNFGCPRLDREALRAKLASLKSQSKKLNLVFFSTWCLDCKENLGKIAAHPSDDVLAIAVFDTQAKVEKTLRKLNYSISCAMDDGLAKTLGVKTVPARREIDEMSL